MTAASKGVQAQDSSVWQVIVLFRRFLHDQAHEELQSCARALFIAIGRNNEDAVWLALCSTSGSTSGSTGSVMDFLKKSQWDIDKNVGLILSELNVQYK
jgi:hypothetical protein